VPVFQLNTELFFPDPDQFQADGLVAIGGDLRPERLLLAYQRGIFPWCSPEDPLLWWSPDPRAILRLEGFKKSKSLRNILNRGVFELRIDTEFERVIRACSERGEEGTWISEDFVKGSCQLHELGFAHSIESWKDGELVGGLYGVSIGGLFYGESMFSRVSNASKVALAHLVEGLRTLGFEGLDCQLMNDHLASLGAEHISRAAFLKMQERAMKRETVRGNWTDLDAFQKAAAP
jgi:leucyl/phenylalanyl-tRNA--protein transferase